LELFGEDEFSGICMDGRVGRDNDRWNVSDFTLDNYRAFPAIFRDHDPGRIVAVALAIGLCNALEVGIRGRFLPSISADAAEAQALVRAGALKGLSAGIAPQEVEPLKDGTRGMRVLKADLLEVSIVPIPASVDAKILAARSLSTRPATAALLRGLPRISDIAIERALAQVRRLQLEVPPVVRILEPWELVANERERAARHCRTVSALQMVERERSTDLSYAQRQSDLQALRGRR
jgi:HK97 family phage prohead protease